MSSEQNDVFKKKKKKKEKHVVQRVVPEQVAADIYTRNAENASCVLVSSR